MKKNGLDKLKPEAAEKAQAEYGLAARKNALKKHNKTRVEF